MVHGRRAGWFSPRRARRVELIDSFEHSEAEPGELSGHSADQPPFRRDCPSCCAACATLGTGPERISVLDVGTGSADIPAALLRWAKRRGRDVRGRARRKSEGAPVRARGGPRESSPPAREGRATALPFAASSFDCVLSSLTFHHFDEATAASAFAEMHRVARRGVIVNDLRRGYLPAALIWLVTRLALRAPPDPPRRPAERHARADHPRVPRELARRAGLPEATVHKHPFWRAALVVRK